MFPIESRLYEDVKPATTKRGAGNETLSSEFDDSNETLFPMVSRHAGSNLVCVIPTGLLAHSMFRNYHKGCTVWLSAALSAALLSLSHRFCYDSFDGGLARPVMNALMHRFVLCSFRRRYVILECAW